MKVAIKDNIENKYVSGWKLALFAGSAALGLGMAGSANAAAYGFASHDVSDFELTATAGSYTLLSGSIRSTSSATYNGTGPAADVSGPLGGNADALQSAAGPGPFPGQNNFNQALTGSLGGRGDSQIQGLSGSLVSEARAVGASSFAGGDSAATAVFQISVTAGTQLQFGFDSIINLIADTDYFSESSLADLGTNFSIALDGSGGETIFTWAPNGISDRPGETDPFSLNTDLSASDGSSPAEINLSGTFLSPLTQALAAGNYVLSFVFDTKVRVSSAAAPVPEPGMVGLFGLGLLGLARLRRRKVR